MVEVKEEVLTAVEEVKAAVELLATVKKVLAGGGGHVDEGREGAGRCGSGRG